MQPGLTNRGDDAPYDISVLVCTRNRAAMIGGCLDAIAMSIDRLGGGSVEIVVVDNGSTDDTAEVLRAWSSHTALALRVVQEERPGLSRARNAGVRAARGRLLVFTDDDCRLGPAHLSDALAYDRADGNDLVLRGGRVELGDAADLPFTITRSQVASRYHKPSRPVRRMHLGGLVLGCNMAFRKALFDRVGPFDERFGAGGPFRAAEDTDFMFRAYIAGAAVEYVPDMMVRHFHGRRSAPQLRQLMRCYDEAEGAVYAKFWRSDLALVRQFYWDAANALRECLGTAPTLMCGHTHRAKVASNVRGAMRYWIHGRRLAADRPSPRRGEGRPRAAGAGG